jgi:uncharacterized protein (DUF305 family)
MIVRPHILVVASSRLLCTVLLLGGAACARSGVQLAPGAGIQPVDGSRPAAVSATANRFIYTQADVQFMAGMIPHHAQAIRMALWAPTHAASREVRMLAERIVVSQRDEIGLMQFWLRERGERVPAADATHHRMSMNGVEHDMLMPGMLTDEELARLERARGNEFDRMFLAFMIRHHDGALTMVEELFAAAGAAHDDVVYTFASDVWADQTSEIDRMEKMLAALPAGGASR